MADEQRSPEYLLANPRDIESLANKLAQFCQTLSPVEQSLLMERIKRSMPGADVRGVTVLSGSPDVFGAWINSVVPDGSRWFPETEV